MPIKILDPQTVSRIAAGEVVERPSSVVKELVENALDAGASQITVDTQGGGVTLIKVTDNGSGIPADEVELAFTRHATSKINALSDLEKIATLGFRGEALPSIAAVADVELVTRAASDAAASYLRLANGEIIQREKRSRPQGTTVTVHHLFRHFPARLKFLKSSTTENSHIVNTLTQYAFAFPEVKFSLSIDGRLSLRAPGNGKLRDAVAEIYSLEVARQMMDTEETEHGYTVKGLVSPPSLSRSSRNYLSFFINRRWVHSSLLTRAVEDAYQGLLMAGKRPIAIINISLPSQELDVNVHPSKTEVKFRNSQLVYSVVARTIKNTLHQAPPPQLKKSASIPPAPRLLTAEVGDRTDFTQITYPTPRPANDVVKNGDVPALPILRVVGQLAASYIMAEGPEGLYLIDQHAAHERVIFDKVLAQRSQQQIEIQGLLEPATIELSPGQEHTLNSRAELLNQFGFSLEHFGNRSYLLRAVPAVMAGANLVEAVRSLLDALSADEEVSKREQTIAQSLACHGAVKAGQQLSFEEMRGLIRQLEVTASPHTCPHGRPTMVYLSSRQLAKEFGR